MDLRHIIKETLLEGLKYDDGDYSLSDEDTVDDILSLNNNIIYEQMNGETVMIGLPLGGPNKNQFINDLKWGEIDNKLKHKILNKVIKDLDGAINLGSFDFILSPKSSSPINAQFLHKLRRKTDAKVLSSFFVKNKIENISLDIDRAISDGRNNRFIKQLKNRFEFAKGMEGASIKLQPLNRYQREYIKDFLVTNTSYSKIIPNMVDKKVLVVDDITTSGKTLMEMIKLLQVIGVNDTTIFSIFN